jgi:hypothetical protein
MLTYSIPTSGMVVFWNLPTNSPLQRIRLPDGSLKLYPFQCFLAHDQAVRTIQWCKANRYRIRNMRSEKVKTRTGWLFHIYSDLIFSHLSSHFLVSAGSDRKIKFWDLRRPYEPINCIKRFLSTELAWLLPYNGVTVAQDNCYASYGKMETAALGIGPKGGGYKACQIIWGRRGLSWFTEVVWILGEIGEKKLILEKGSFIFFLFLIQLWTLWNSLYWCWLPWFQSLLHCSSKRHCLGETLSFLQF